MRIVEDSNTEKMFIENLWARNWSDNENYREPELSWIDPQVNLASDCHVSIVELVVVGMRNAVYREL